MDSSATDHQAHRRRRSLQPRAHHQRHLPRGRGRWRTRPRHSRAPHRAGGGPAGAQFPTGATPSVEDVQNAVEKVLIENGHARTAKAYILYREERARRRSERDRREAQAQESIPWRKLWEVLNWAVDHDLHTVARLNQRLARGEWAEVIRESDAAYQQDIAQAAEQIIARRGEVRIAIVAGPSSSGKTTTTTKLSLLLRDKGLRLVPLTVDHYFLRPGAASPRRAWRL